MSNFIFAVVLGNMLTATNCQLFYEFSDNQLYTRIFPKISVEKYFATKRQSIQS